MRMIASAHSRRSSHIIHCTAAFPIPDVDGSRNLSMASGVWWIGSQCLLLILRHQARF